MKCRHFGSCGSCTLYDLSYARQLERKAERVRGLLRPYYEGEFDCFDSPVSHYRARAEFRIWHEGDACSYAMGNLSKEGSVTIDECPKVISAIDERMEPLLEAVNASPELSRRLFGVEFLATTTGECLITLLYHRRLEEPWIAEARGLQKRLKASVIGRSRKQKEVLDREYVTETLEIDSKKYQYRHYEGGFTQPNPFVNAEMIAWAKARAAEAGGGDLLEAYCGLGNFTIPLSIHFEKVLATEISKNSIRAAKENCALNGVENIEFVRLSSEEMTQALRKERSFNRLRHVDLENYDFSTVMVDPPRAGLDEATRALISGVGQILYISCNPETLARDLAELTRTHRVERAAIFDQFPYTEHVECGVLLARRS
ncbi:tRNA (uridine(54)-C5)-methyltransferase TrmA [Nitratifractor sp.]